MLFRWYAAILETTGAAIASVSVVNDGINQQDVFSKTALHYAAIEGHINVVQLLIEAGNYQSTFVLVSSFAILIDLIDPA